MVGDGEEESVQGEGAQGTTPWLARGPPKAEAGLAASININIILKHRTYIILLLL